MLHGIVIIVLTKAVKHRFVLLFFTFASKCCWLVWLMAYKALMTTLKKFLMVNMNGRKKWVGTSALWWFLHVCDSVEGIGHAFWWHVWREEGPGEQETESDQLQVQRRLHRTRHLPSHHGVASDDPKAPALIQRLQHSLPMPVAFSSQGSDTWMGLRTIPSPHSTVCSDLWV